MSNVTHFRNYLAIIKRINWFCKRTVALGDEFWEFRNYWNLLLVFLPFSVAKKKSFTHLKLYCHFYFINKSANCFCSNLHSIPLTPPSFLAKSCLKAFLITLLLIDLAPDNCLFAAVKKLLFFKLLLVSRNNPMLIFDDYLHNVLDIISTGFPWVCPFVTLASPNRIETYR